MSKSRHPKAPTSRRPESLPEPREPSLRELPTEPEAAHEDFSHVPEEGAEHYDEHGQPYAAEEPLAEHAEAHEHAYAEHDQQHYDENGQPYYDENGQPYYDENGQPYDPNAYPQEYATAPMEQMPGQMPMHAHPHAMHADPRHGQMNLPHAPQMQMQLHSHPPGVPIPAPPPSHGGPYRVAPGDQPVFQGFPQAKPPRPVLGSAIAIYGVLLWSFVVAGQFATSWIEGAPMSQGTAAFLVFLATGAAWGFALHRSRYVLPSVKMARFIWRGIGIGALAFVMFFFTLILATIFGQSTHGHDFFIAFVLVALSVAAIIVGPRLTIPKGQAKARTHRMKFAVVSMWVVGVLLTFVAGAELASNG